MCVCEALGHDLVMQISCISPSRLVAVMHCAICKFTKFHANHRFVEEMKKVHLWKNWETNAESRGKAAEKSFSIRGRDWYKLCGDWKRMKRWENEFLKDIISPKQRLPQVTSAFQSIECWNRLSHYWTICDFDDQLVTSLNVSEGAAGWHGNTYINDSAINKNTINNTKQQCSRWCHWSKLRHLQES